MKRHFTYLLCLIVLVSIVFFLAIKKPQKAICAPAANTTSAVAVDTTTSSNVSFPPEITLPSSAGEIYFPHQQHSEDFEVECITCHHEINASNFKLPHEDYFNDFYIDCRICHHENKVATLSAQPCSKCHHKYPADIADETLSSKVVIHKSCWECHEVGTGGDATMNCKICHSGPRTTF